MGNVPLKMNIFLCHTPLHLFISLLVIRSERLVKSVVVVVHDALGISELAQRIFEGTGSEIVNLPGMASSKSGIGRALILKYNVGYLLRNYSFKEINFFIFYDLRPETQSLLNHAARNSTKAKFTLLEDGVAIYPPGGSLRFSIASVLKNKWAGGWDWKGYDQVGIHPRLDEIRCFYPDLIRLDLKFRTIRQLPSTIPDDMKLIFSAELEEEKDRLTIAALPHTSFIEGESLSRVIDQILRYCKINGTRPIFKLHPRDLGGAGRLLENLRSPSFVPQHLPVELALLGYSNAHSLIGFRTSALHICAAIFPKLMIYHLDASSSKEGAEWSDFLGAVGVRQVER